MNKSSRMALWALDGFVLLLLAACLWVPDSGNVLGRVLVWDQFRHWDNALMMPGLAYISGGGLNTTIASGWASGAVMAISRLSQMTGGFDDVHVLTVMMVMVVVYYALLYAFLKCWLRSGLLAAGFVAIAVKLQMFHAGISPLIWIYPQDTALRHWPDLLVLLFLWRHGQTGKPKFLLLAASAIGIVLAWCLTVGLCMLAAFWAYLIFLSMTGQFRVVMTGNYLAVRKTCLTGLLPLMAMVLITGLLNGPAIFQASFWTNIVEPLQLFLHGVGTESLYACLYDRHFFAFIVAFVIPMIYVTTLLLAARQESFLVPLCVYGLALYGHYLAHPVTSHYYAVGLPVVMVLAWWAACGLSRFWKKRTLILLLFTIGAWGALATNFLFIYYPNIFNISRMDWASEKTVYQNQYQFHQDAGMIDRLTPASASAPVIGSFETEILMEAHRKPFFYYAPLVQSTPEMGNAFLGTSIITPQRLNTTIDQIVSKHPQYIYIEKRLLSQWTPQLAQYFPGIILVLRYIIQNYTPQDQGLYLVAMQRKAE